MLTAKIANNSNMQQQIQSTKQENFVLRQSKKNMKSVK